MSGWLVLLVLALATLGIVRATMPIDRGTVMLVAAALCVASAGYALQGSPAFPGAPRVAARAETREDGLYVGERGKLMQVFGEPAQWLVLADGLNRSGDDRGAAKVLETQTTRHPRDLPLAIGYAHALLVLADYNYTPAVALAFQRAEAIDPNSPVPLYFEGLAHFEGRDMIAAERSWRGLHDALPPTSQWRAMLADRLKLFDMMRAEASR